MKLPLKFDLTLAGKIVECKEIGEEGYFENEQYILQICYSHDYMSIQYYYDDNFIFDDDPRLLKYILSIQDK